MSEPEKLGEIIQVSETRFCLCIATAQQAKEMVVFCNTKEQADEVFKRYNAYPDQQAIIEQLVNACKRANQRLSEHGDTERMITRKKLIYALAAAEKMEAKNGKDSL